MNTRLSHAFPFLAGLVFLCGLRPDARAQESPKLTGTYSVERGVKVLRLWGTPRERGFAHGWLLGKETLEGFDSGLSMFLAGDKGRYEMVAAAVPLGFSFSNAEEEELVGLQEGIKARLPENERKLQAVGREVTLLDLKILNVYGDVYSLSCSSAALWGSKTADGKAAVVRNFDFFNTDLLVRSQHVRISAPLPGDPQSKGWVGISHPGCIGTMTALSEDGVFVSIHDVFIRPEPKDYLQSNVPRLIALKRIVAELPAAGAVEKAAERCKSWNTIFGNNFMVATPDPAGGLPAGVIEYDTREERDKGATLRKPDVAGDGSAREFLVCSNHYRSRASGRCDRYDALIRGCGEKVDKPLDARALFRLGERASVSGFIATLHQTVAFTGTKRLWVRLVAPGKKIKEIEPVEFNVVECLAGLQGAPKPEDGSSGSKLDAFVSPLRAAPSSPRMAMEMVMAAVMAPGEKAAAAEASKKGTRQEADMIPTSKGDLKIVPIEHATFILEWNGKSICVDPVGAPERLKAFPAPDVILLTDIHPDHMNGATVKAIAKGKTVLVMPKAVSDALLAAEASLSKLEKHVLAIGEKASLEGLTVEATAAYNTTPERRKYHEKGRGVGYLLELGGKRVYISGDTEDIPEMRKLKGIDVAFLCMNLPYTMTVEQAASAVLEFQPKVVYPYHSKGQDTGKLKALVEAKSKSIDVRLRDWYPKK